MTECDHCGRTEPVQGLFVPQGNSLFKLCHANPDGTKSDPDCYHLVTTGAEKLGSRRK